MKEPLRESLASATGSSVGEEVGTEPSTASKRVIVSVAGPGFSDAEEFDIADLRSARASARKLMASAIRLFGRAEGSESE